MTELFSLALLLATQGVGPAHRFEWGNPRPQGNAIRALAFADLDHGYAVGSLGAAVATEDGGLTWARRGDLALFSTDLNDLVVVEGGDLIAVGASPGIFRSSDGGASWSEVAHPGTALLRSLERVDASKLVAIGDAGTVLVSVDSGATWTASTFPEDAGLFEQFWLSPSRGFVIGEGTPHETNDGGASWTPLPGVTPPVIEHHNEIVFGTPLDGWILDDFGQWSTSDGGASWTWTDLFVEPLYRGEMLAFDASHLILSTNGEGAFLWETFDGGVQWELIHELPSAVGFLDLVRLDDGRLVASTDLGDLAWSSDGGATWTNATRSPIDGPRIEVAAIDLLANGRAFAGGRDSSSYHRFLRSDDAGRSWYEIEHPVFDVEAIAFVDDSLGFVGGDWDTITRTADGGVSWQSIDLGGALGGNLNVNDFAFTTSALFASSLGPGGKGAVFRSVDGGLSWQLSNTGLPINRIYTSISFPASLIGLVCGGGSGVKWLYRTLDGGASWQSMSVTALPDFLYATHWFDLANGLLTSRSAGIWRTDDAGQSWTQVWAQPCTRMHFRDDSSGIASTTTGAIVTSDDAGWSWQEVDVPLEPSWFMGREVLATPRGFLIGTSRTNLLVATTRLVEGYCECDGGSGPCGNGDAEAGCANSSGRGALLSATSSTSIAADDLMLFATPLPPNQSALLFMGAGETELPFGDGRRCVSAGGLGLFRYPVRNTGPDGLLREGPGLVALSHQRFSANGHIHAGQTWRFQAWYRDPTGPCGSAFNLSNALRVTFEP